MLSKTENKYLLVSAATSDIGFAIVQRLVDSYNIVLHGRDQKKLDSILERIETNRKIITWCYDLKNIDELQGSLKKIIVDNSITITGFVHCAGTLRILPLKNFRLDYSREIFDVNFFSAAEIIKTLLLKINKEGLNCIVLISSVFSKFGSKGNSMYAASKGAIDSFVNSMAVELAPDIRINSILPGGLHTNMTNHFFESEEYMKGFEQKYLLGEGECCDIAAMVSFLFSKDAKWITGQHFIVDGGATCH
jgi:short-subunit dehydrogenase